MPAGKEGLVLKVRDDVLLIVCLSAERLEFVLAKSWEVLPERNWRRLVRASAIANGDVCGKIEVIIEGD
jgi:hypothetical protein